MSLPNFHNTVKIKTQHEITNSNPREFEAMNPCNECSNGLNDHPKCKAECNTMLALKIENLEQKNVPA